MDRGALQATVHGVAKSQAQLSDQHTHTHTKSLETLNVQGHTVSQEQKQDSNSNWSYSGAHCDNRNNCNKSYHVCLNRILVRMVHLMYYSQPTPNDSEELPATRPKSKRRVTLCSYFPCIVKLSLCATLTILSDNRHLCNHQHSWNKSNHSFPIVSFFLIGYS